MATPQAEHGHIDIANEIAEALAKIEFSAYESKCLWVIWRQTYGGIKKKMLSISTDSKNEQVCTNRIFIEPLLNYIFGVLLPVQVRNMDFKKIMTNG